MTAKNEIATARYAIRDAENNGAAQHAPAELAAAREKLEDAKRATPDVAVRLAAEATVDARLGSAIAARDNAIAQLAEAERVEREAAALRSKTTDAVQEQTR